MKKTILLLCTALFMLICVFLLTRCNKFYSYEGGLVTGNNTGTAVFTFVGAGGNCTGSVLSGKYYAGTLLTSADTVQLMVNVTTVGSYSVNTSLINGFKFTGSGNFTNTGVQTITLTGAGTPTSEGDFTFTTPLGLGCSFTVVVTKQPTIMANYTLAGAPNACQNAEINGSYFYGAQLTASNIVVLNVNVIAVGAYNLNTDTLDGIYFAASGTFTQTGAQSVVLKAYGTPTIPNNLIFTPKASSSSCSFNIAVLAPGAPATYVLQSGFGNPSPCIYTVTGNYLANTPLSATNNVSISVYVTVVGSFSIATNTVNGISFSYTGTFTSLGNQNVILYGSGTPTATGSFGFLPQIVGPAPLGGASCGFTVTVK